jgi:hypothetical protein
MARITSEPSGRQKHLHGMNPMTMSHVQARVMLSTLPDKDRVSFRA